MTPAISVVVTCYNLERFIGQALESVLAQLDAPPFELIVVDDCSSDGSADVIARFRQATLVRTVRNGGVLNAMIAGVERASHDLICLLDGDDLWEAGKLATSAAAFAADPGLALLTHDLRFIDGEGRFCARSSRPRNVLTPLGARAAGEQVRTGILEQDDYVWLGSALSFRRSAARWEEFVQFCRCLPDAENCYQDWPLAYWIASLPGVRLEYRPDCLLRYRIHGGNHSGDARTAERAARNFKRTANTHDAMARIALIRHVAPALRKQANSSARFTRAQADLYAGRRVGAAAAFMMSVPFAWRRRILVKESVRFVAGVLLGPNILVRLVTRGKRGAKEGRAQ